MNTTRAVLSVIFSIATFICLILLYRSYLNGMSAFMLNALIVLGLFLMFIHLRFILYTGKVSLRYLMIFIFFMSIAGAAAYVKYGPSSEVKNPARTYIGH